MKNKNFSFLNMLFLATLLCTGCSKTDNSTVDENAETITVSTEAYYWYKDQKIPLLENDSKKYILFEAAKEAAVNAFLSQKNITVIEAAQNLNISSRQPHDSKQMPENLKWMIVSGNAGTLATATSPILYEGPFFKTTKGEEAGLSHLFYVELSDEPKSLSVLEKLAAKNKVFIIGNNKYMPQSYTLACDKSSVGNAMQMANGFYETGYFASCQPDLMVSIVLN